MQESRLRKMFGYEEEPSDTEEKARKYFSSINNPYRSSNNRYLNMLDIVGASNKYGLAERKARSYIQNALAPKQDSTPKSYNTSKAYLKNEAGEKITIEEALENPGVDMTNPYDGVTEPAEDNTPKLKQTDTTNASTTGTAKPATKNTSNTDGKNLASLDVATELPRLSKEQIAEVIKKHFGKSTVIKPEDAQGIYEAQEESGMSALAILGIGALESGYGTSQIAKEKNNLWGWNATNTNPGGNATAFSPVSEGAKQFANSYMKTYYNGYGARSINSAGTGDNPSGKGYAYNNDGSISTTWASSINSIMGTFYNTASNVNGSTNTQTSGASGSVGEKIANTDSYNNDAAEGQCVWYVRGRAKEKLGVDPGAIGNGNEMYYNAKDSAKVKATEDNIKEDMIVSYGKGTSSAGQKYGHVIYIEKVVGDTVYYTEGGSGYHKNGTDGTLKVTTKKGILNGTDSKGNRFGSGVIGFIDMTKY